MNETTEATTEATDDGVWHVVKDAPIPDPNRFYLRRKYGRTNNYPSFAAGSVFCDDDLWAHGPVPPPVDAIAPPPEPEPEPEPDPVAELVESGTLVQEAWLDPTVRRSGGRTEMGELRFVEEEPSEGSVPLYRVAGDAPIMLDPQTEHVVTLGEDTFTVRHPLHEPHPEGAMESCGLHTYLANLDGPPRLPGRYAARLHGDVWQFRPLTARPEGDR